MVKTVENLFENWRKYLSEQPRSVPSFAKGAQRQEVVLNYYSRWKEKLQDTGEKFDNYNIFSHDAGDGIVYFLINSEGTPKLYLFLDGKDHTVDPVMKAEDAKDIFTSKFYKYLMGKNGFISSGKDQSPDSQKVWDRFKSDDTVSVEPFGKLQKRATLK